MRFPTTQLSTMKMWNIHMRGKINKLSADLNTQLLSHQTFNNGNKRYISFYIMHKIQLKYDRV